jgi:hypothetical protein
MEGITVTLQRYKGRKASGFAMVETTNSAGSYSFVVANPMAGVTYEISVSPPAGQRISQPTSQIYSLSLASTEVVQGENFGLTHSKVRRSGPPTLAPFGPFILDDASFTQALDGLGSDPKAITNFFGTGAITLSKHGVYLSFDLTNCDGTNPSEDSGIILSDNPLRRFGKGNEKFDGYGSASITVDSNVYSFTLRFTGTVFQSHASSSLHGNFFAIDVNGNKLDRGPQPIFDGSFSE